MAIIDESQLDPIGKSPSTGGNIIDESQLDPVTSTEPELDLLGSAKKSLLELPKTLLNIPGSLYDTGKNLYDAVTNPSLQTIDKAARTTGPFAAAMAGAGTGGTAGLAFGPGAIIASPLLAAVGGAAGMLGFNKLNQATGADAPSNPVDDVNNLVYNSVQGVALDGALRAAGKGVSTAVGPQSKAAATATVADALKKYVTPEDVGAGLKDIRGDSLGGLRTSAEVTGSPELAILEQSLGSGGKALDYADYQNRVRPSSRDWILDQVSKAEDIAPETSGESLKNSISDVQKSAKAEVNSLYDAIPEDTVVKGFKLKTQIQDAKGDFYGPGAEPVPGRLQSLINDITNPENKNQFTIPELQRLRSRAGTIAKVASRAGEGEEAGLASVISKSIAETIDNAPDGATEWKTANSAYREYAQTFKEGPLKKILDKDFLPSAVTKKIMSSPEAASKLTSILDGDPGALEPIKNQIVSDLSDMSDAKKVTFIDKNESQLKTLLGGDFYYLKSIRDDIASKTSTQKLANATGGSNTALKLSNVIEKALTGKDAPAKAGLWDKVLTGAGFGGAGALAFQNPALGLPAVLAGYGIKALRGRSNNLIQSSLYENLMNPRVLKKTLNSTYDSTVIPKSVSSGLLGLTEGTGNSDLEREKADSLSTALSTLSKEKDMPKEQAQTNSNAEPKGQAPKGTDDTSIPDISNAPKDTKKRVSYVESIIDSNPVDSAIYQMESGRNPLAKNKSSSASGAFQLLKGTAKNLGVKDVFDIADNYQGYQKLKEENQALLDKLGYDSEDPVLLYSAHYLGGPVLTKYLKGEELTDKEQSQVRYLKNTVLPKFLKIYNQQIEA